VKIPLYKSRPVSSLYAALLLLPIFLIGCNKAQYEISFAEMQPGDRIEVDFESFGCFHHDHYDFIFYGESPKRVEIRKDEPKDTTLIRTMTLTSNQLQKLDNMLYMNRLALVGSSTTTNKISLKLYREEKLIATEEHVDDVGACTRASGVLPLSWIAECAKQGSTITAYPELEDRIDIAEIKKAFQEAGK
jgi:hypothetical protein